ncbi:MAG TPA: hypothetical protein VMZ66_02525 [Aeromicrobium sp.]|nr:hypothetical protein [Aeromicrobium sp.]
MDVNYSRWMSKDPDEPEVVEDESRRFRFPRPAGSVASAALVALVALGGAAFVRSMATPEDSADQAQTAVETPTAEESTGPGAASVDESSDDSTSEDSTSDDFADESTTRDRPERVGPRLMARRELRRSNGMPPGRPWRDRPPRGDSTRPALPPPMLRR